VELLSPVSQEVFEVPVLIIGGGVAGISAALWCARLGLKSLILERSSRPGGQLYDIHNTIPDYPAFVGTGKDMASRLIEQMAQFDISCRTDVKVESLDVKEGRAKSAQGIFQAQAIILATGIQKRLLPLLKAEAFLEKGLYLTASGRRSEFVDQEVCIIGGGDGAFENALLLADSCPKVTILYRGTTPRARPDFVLAVEELPHVEYLLEHQVVDLKGIERLETLVVQTPEGTKEFSSGATLVKIGMEPRSHLVREQVVCSPGGFVLVDAFQRSISHENLWAIGDICTPLDPSISVCVGQACVAAREIERTFRKKMSSI